MFRTLSRLLPRPKPNNSSNSLRVFSLFNSPSCQLFIHYQSQSQYSCFHTTPQHLNDSKLTYMKKKKVNAEKMLKIHNSSSLSFFVRRMHNFSSPSFLIRQQQQLSSVVFCDMMSIQSERYFSSIPSNKNNKRSNKEKKPMKNQELVDFLRRRNRGKDIDQIEVRVVADIPAMSSSSSDEKNNDNNEKSKRSEVFLISLQAAMEKAQDLRLDLFEVHLQQKPPVLRCADYGKFFYDLKKKAKKMVQGTKQKPTKEYKFRVSIIRISKDQRISHKYVIILSFILII